MALEVCGYELYDGPSSAVQKRVLSHRHVRIHSIWLRDDMDDDEVRLFAGQAELQELLQQRQPFRRISNMMQRYNCFAYSSEHVLHAVSHALVSPFNPSLIAAKHLPLTIAANRPLRSPTPALSIRHYLTTLANCVH